MPYTYEYPHPSVTVDMVVFTLRGDDLAVLLIKRKNDPFKGHWALPGGFVDENEALERAAARELEEETGLTHPRFEQLGAFGDPGRDPRGHTVSVAYLSYIGAERAVITAGDDAAEAKWHSLAELDLPVHGQKQRTARATPTPKTAAQRGAAARAAAAAKLLPLAFDHATIIDVARARLQNHLTYPTRSTPYQLLPPRFTLAEMLHVYQAVLGRPMNRASFGRTLIGRGVIEPVMAKSTGRSSTRLYRFVTKRG
jgi:8-oxo-dGTP diphosphatase